MRGYVSRSSHRWIEAKKRRLDRASVVWTISANFNSDARRGLADSSRQLEAIFGTWRACQRSFKKNVPKIARRSVEIPRKSHGFRF